MRASNASEEPPQWAVHPPHWCEMNSSNPHLTGLVLAGRGTHSHQLFLSCLLVLHTGKRWFIICPVAEHPAVEAPESSPPLPLSSLQPDTSQGMSSQNSQPCLLDNSVCFLCIAPHRLMVLSLTLLVLMFCQHMLCAKQSAKAPPCTVTPKPRAVCGAVSLSVSLSQLSTK